MQLITQNDNSVVVFTLAEKQTLTSPYWLFEFTYRGGNNAVKTFIATDLSSFPEVYNQFLITESTSEVLTSGTVNLPYVGEWHYRIFEQSSSTNLLVANATTECENGIIMVIPSSVTNQNIHQITDSSVIYTPTQY